MPSSKLEQKIVHGHEKFDETSMSPFSMFWVSGKKSMTVKE